MINMKNLLTENMRRFGTKNLNEQDFDQNNNGYPDETEQSNTPAGSDSDNDLPRDIQFVKDDDGDREDMLMANIEASIDDLLSMAKEESYNIGGEFRGPGVWDRVKKLIKSKL